MLAEPILKAIDYDMDNTVFSFIPNTAEVAFFGMKESGRNRRSQDETIALTARACPRGSAGKCRVRSWFQSVNPGHNAASVPVP